MDAASILVLVLVAGVAPLLMWFEINSRKNDARAKTSTSVQAGPKEKPRTESERQKAA